MIEVKKLNKVYNSKKKKICHALKDINITLPDIGLVFVLGKSGSGKSTLLNLIGGLDNITSGEIIVDGNDLSKFSEKEFCNYRNSHIGFIFQDYHLLDELTIYENIVLSLDLKGEMDQGKVKEALSKVDLAGYEDRYPTELSGGEQQRVAIARAFVKNPHIILADEPTGNLDSETSKQIITLLQELSKDCLILIVSHNIGDANKYADRIIELKKGEVIKDVTRNEQFLDYVSIVDGKLVYPSGLKLSCADVDLINANKNKELIIQEDKFLPTKQVEEKMKKIVIENKKIKFKKEEKIAFEFLKNKVFTIIISAIMVSAIMVIMALAQTIIAFDGNKMIQEEMNNYSQDYLLLNKELSSEVSLTLASGYRAKISDDEIEEFYEAGYNGKIYPVYSYSLPIRNTGTYYGTNNNHFYQHVYLMETFGTMIVDEEYLQKKFGNYEYVAHAGVEKPYGIYITDLAADSLLAVSDNYAGKNYIDLVGDFYILGTAQGIYINGIIDTGYRERYSELFNDVLSGKINSSNVYDNSAFLEFINEVYDSLGFNYTTNPNFLEDIKVRNPILYKININNQDYYKGVSNYAFYNSSLESDSIVLNYEIYNAIFKTSYNIENLKTFVPHKITLAHYDYEDVKNENPLFKKEVTIVALTHQGYTMEVSKDIKDLFSKDSIRAYQLYFDGISGAGNVLELANELNYSNQSLTIESVYTMIKAVDVFIPVFRLIAIVISAGVILIFVNFSTKMIKDKMHEIGILKALGTKNLSIIVIFGLQILLITILTCIVSSLGYLVFIDLANDVLVDSLRQLASNRILLDLNFLVFKPKIALINCALVFALALVSLVSPLVRIKIIKPVKIIKTRD